MNALADRRPKPLKDLLSGLRRQWRRASAHEGLALPEVLARCLGPERAALVGFGGLSARGTLTLTAPSAAQLAELEGFAKAGLLQALQETAEGRKVRDIRFVPEEAGDGR